MGRSPKGAEAIQRRQTTQLNQAARQFEAQKTSQNDAITSAVNRQEQAKALGAEAPKDPNAIRDPEEAAKLTKLTSTQVKEKPEEGWLSQAAGAVGDGLQALWDGTCWVGQKIWDGISAVGAGLWWTASTIGQGAWWTASTVGQGLWTGATMLGTGLYTVGGAVFGTTAGTAVLGVGAIALATNTSMSSVATGAVDGTMALGSGIMSTGRGLNSAITAMNQAALMQQQAAAAAGGGGTPPPP
jgi:hypothetical protein